ncbi:hypothetical protein ACWC9T_38230 [Kitasatospora sp. NPDC001159]
MMRFLLDVRMVLLGLVGLGNLWWLYRLITVRRLRRQREGVPVEQQLAELRAELAAAPSNTVLLDLLKAKYPAVGAEQAAEVARSVGPWQVIERGPDGAPSWVFRHAERAPQDKPPTEQRRLGPLVKLLSVVCTLLALATVWFTYPHVNRLVLAGIWVAYGAALLLLVRWDVGWAQSVLLVLPTLLIGGFAFIMVIGWAHSHAVEKAGGSGGMPDAVGLVLSLLFGLLAAVMPILVEKGQAEKSAARKDAGERR